ncbi:MAG: glycosyltransferase [Bacteroidota bacterium]
MTKYLPKYGWSPIIYTPDDPEFNISDKSLSENKDEIKVIRNKIWDPANLFKGSKNLRPVGEVSSNNISWWIKLAIWIRGNIFIPDSKIFWVRPSLRYLTRYLKKNPVDAIITTGPPHSMHMIGYGLKKILNVSWMADFRDPWSNGDILNQIFSSGFAMRQHKKMERRVLLNADIVVTVGNRLAEDFKLLEQNAKLSVVTNGFDHHDFPSKEIEKNNKQFNITYSGILYKNRNPSLLWQYLNNRCMNDQIFSQQLKINIVGHLDEAVKEELMAYKGLNENLNLIGYLSHEDAIELNRNASLLILPVDNTKNSKILTPGKLFEYLATNRPIIGFGDKDSDANDILLETGHRGIIDYNDEQSIASEIDLHYNNWKDKETATYENIENFRRENLSGKIAEILDEITNG